MRQDFIFDTAFERISPPRQIEFDKHVGRLHIQIPTDGKSQGLKAKRVGVATPGLGHVADLASEARAVPTNVLLVERRTWVLFCSESAARSGQPAAFDSAASASPREAVSSLIFSERFSAAKRGSGRALGSVTRFACGLGAPIS